MVRKLTLGALVLTAGLMPAVAFGATAYLSSGADMYAGPDFDYPVVDGIPPGDGVVVHGCLRDWSWCDIGYRGERGWVLADELLGEYESRRMPIVDIGPRLGLGSVEFSFSNYWDNHYSRRDFYRERERWSNYSRDHARDHDRRRTERVQARQRAERDAHDRAHQENVRAGMYDTLKKQEVQKRQHEAQRRRNEAEKRKNDRD